MSAERYRERRTREIVETLPPFPREIDATPVVDGQVSTVTCRPGMAYVKYYNGIGDITNNLVDLSSIDRQKHQIETNTQGFSPMTFPAIPYLVRKTYELYIEYQTGGPHQHRGLGHIKEMLKPKLRLFFCNKETLKFEPFDHELSETITDDNYIFRTQDLEIHVSVSLERNSMCHVSAKYRNDESRARARAIAIQNAQKHVALSTNRYMDFNVNL